jgi:hypothetical protein
MTLKKFANEEDDERSQDGKLIGKKIKDGCEEVAL